MLISVYLSVHIQKQMLTTSSVDIMRWMNGCMLTTSISCLYVVIMTWICLHPHVNMLTTPSWHIHLHINKLTTSRVSSACWHIHKYMLTTSQEYVGNFTWICWQLQVYEVDNVTHNVWMLTCAAGGGRAGSASRVTRGRRPGNCCPPPGPAPPRSLEII